MNASFFQDLLGSIAERGRALIERSGGRPAVGPDGHAAGFAAAGPETLEGLCRELLSGRGEASGVALARQVLDLYARAPSGSRLEFFRLLARDFGPDQDRLRAAWATYDQAPTPPHLQALLRAVEPPRQELFRRLNLAPGGTAALVRMRQDLLKLGGGDPELASVDDDLAHLLSSWFNRGFLVLRHIDWSTPADILERIIRYEAVHEIQGWDDLRRRVQPSDRRCFAFFHPSMIDEPLIFVEVALTREIPGSIQGLLAEEREVLPVGEARTAVFYSISNCQPGLARRVVRQFPDQAGGRGVVARAPVAHDLRHPVPGAPVCGLARQARDWPRTRARLASDTTLPSSVRGPSCCHWQPPTSSAGRAPTASRSTRWPDSIWATALAWSG